MVILAKEMEILESVPSLFPDKTRAQGTEKSLAKFIMEFWTIEQGGGNVLLRN